MEASPFFERSSDPRKVPHILIRGEPFRAVLRAQNPSIIWIPPLRIRSCIRIHQLSRRWNGNVCGIERKTLWVLVKVKKVRMRTSEFGFAVHSERVVPHDPTSAMKTDLLCDQFQFRGILITDRKPKRPRGV